MAKKVEKSVATKKKLGKPKTGRAKLDIGEVSRQSGLPASTLRYYEEKGLIKSTGRNGLRRLFDPTILDQLALIALGRYAGFDLAEIAGIVKANRSRGLSRRRLLEKAQEIDDNIKRLKAMRDGLRHAAFCPEPNQFECPNFQKVIRIAGKTQARAKQQSPGGKRR